MLSLRAACEVGAVEPTAVLAAVAAWPSQYVTCAVAACFRRRHGLASALATRQSNSKTSVVSTLLADNAPPPAINTAIGAGFRVDASALKLALRQRPIDHVTLAMLMAAAPKHTVTNDVVAAATQAAAYDPAGVRALIFIVEHCDSAEEICSGLAMRCALMTGNAAAWDVLREAGGRLPHITDTPISITDTETLVYATCRMRGEQRREAINMLVGTPTRRKEIQLRKNPQTTSPSQGHLAEWACTLLADADSTGINDFMKWVAPLLDAQRSWMQSIYKTAMTFADEAESEKYMAIAATYGSSITPNPLAAMIGLCDADAENAIQWLVDCRPHVLTAAELRQLAEWSTVAAMACNARGPKFARKPKWWQTMARTVMLCCQRTERAPPEIAQHICGFVVSRTEA